MTMTTDPGLAARIVIFVADFGATGVVTNALAIAGELRRTGVPVHFVAGQAEGALLSAVPEGVPVTALLPEGDRWSRRQRLRKLVAPYRRFLAKNAPAVLFSAGNQGHLTSIRAASGVRGLRLVVRISNDPEHESGRGRRSILERFLRRLKFRRIAAAADRMIFVSGGLLDRWTALGAAPAIKSVVIPNGIDVDAVRRRAVEPCDHPWVADGDIPLVLGVGRLVEQKNFETLIRAVELASRTRPLRLLLIGEGPLSVSLMLQAGAAGLRDRFAIIPPVPNPMPYLARAAVVALPSWWEGASNVLLEAIACGTPVVASRTAGNAQDVLDGGAFGVLVSPADAPRLADALLKQVGPSTVLPGERASHFSRHLAMVAYAKLLIDEVEHTHHCAP